MKGLFEIGCCSIDGDGDLLRFVGFKLKRFSEGGWFGRLKIFERAGEGDVAVAYRGVGRVFLFIFVGEIIGFGARFVFEVLFS